MRQQNTRLNGLFTTIEAWESPTGASLAVYHRKADARPIGVVHINHGLAEHAGRYARFAEALSKEGFEVYAHDHRGHGATIAPDASQGVFAETDGWNTVLADIQFVNGEIRKAHPKLPILMFGHSMGGMLAYNYLLRFPETLDGVAVWNAGLSKSPLLQILKLVLKLENKFKGPKTPSIASKFSFEAYNKAFRPNQTTADWLTKDLAEAKTYEDDPDCGWRPSNSMWLDIAEGIEFGANDIGLENVPKDMPVFLLAGDQDPSVEKGKAILDMDKRLKAAGIANLKTLIRKNGRHEALNEPKSERDEVMNTFVIWAKSAVSTIA
ncbi:MAG: alpha/beta hydrolase [Acidimicrobiales bacterium]|nr:alpha/beta hydrolase [Hyphomonadaceae bacterium]RZV43390.1 MAG: alpha/beta hydrolase [Acidimicrobiales bacterium]